MTADSRPDRQIVVAEYIVIFEPEMLCYLPFFFPFLLSSPHWQLPNFQCAARPRRSRHSSISVDVARNYRRLNHL
jgi:hypothetical protein